MISGTKVLLIVILLLLLVILVFQVTVVNRSSDTVPQEQEVVRSGAFDGYKGERRSGGGGGSSTQSSSTDDGEKPTATIEIIETEPEMVTVRIEGTADGDLEITGILTGKSDHCRREKQYEKLSHFGGEHNRRSFTKDIQRGVNDKRYCIRVYGGSGYVSDSVIIPAINN